MRRFCRFSRRTALKFRDRKCGIRADDSTPLADPNFQCRRRRLPWATAIAHMGRRSPVDPARGRFLRRHAEAIGHAQRRRRPAEGPWWKSHDTRRIVARASGRRVGSVVWVRAAEIERRPSVHGRRAPGRRRERSPWIRFHTGKTLADSTQAANVAGSCRRAPHAALIARGGAFSARPACSLARAGGSGERPSQRSGSKKRVRPRRGSDSVAPNRNGRSRGAGDAGPADRGGGACSREDAVLSQTAMHDRARSLSRRSNAHLQGARL